MLGWKLLSFDNMISILPFLTETIVSSTNILQFKTVFPNAGIIRVSSSTMKIPIRDGPNKDPIVTPLFS